MRKGIIILIFGLVTAAAAYGCIYFVCTASARNLQSSDRPELQWLKDEFKLSDAEFKRVTDLHEAYLPKCREMCARIDAQNAVVQKMLENADHMTPEIGDALSQAAMLRAQCQRQMLGHFFEVSRSMSPEQGRRYLSWVNEKAFNMDRGMTAKSGPEMKHEHEM